jgi:hypothetical protein
VLYFIKYNCNNLKKFYLGDKQMKRTLISCQTRSFWRASPTRPTESSGRAKQFWRVGLIFIFSLGISIAYSNLTHAEERGKAIDRVCTMQVDKATAEKLTKDVAADIVPGRVYHANVQNPIRGNMSMNTATNMRV